MKKQLKFAFLILLLASLACSMFNQLVNSNDSKNGNSPENNKVLFKDDFSSSSSGWDQTRDSDGITDYDNNAYRIEINTIGENKNGMSFWSSPGLENQMPPNLTIEVDATKAGGPDDNDFGVICRYTTTNDKPSFYQFMGTSDGYAGILFVSGGDQKMISAEKLQESDAVKKGEASNHIRADCIGSTLTLFINGTQVATATDSTLTKGDVGLIAGTYSTPGTSIIFDNFVVSKP